MNYISSYTSSCHLGEIR